MSQSLVITVSLVFLLLQAWRGCKRGVVRQGLSLFALAIAFAVGYWVYRTLDNLVGSLFKDSQMFVGGLLGLIFGFLVYICMGIPVSILFRNTSQQRSGMIRCFYGLGGAVCGIGTGMLLLWGTLCFIQNAPLSKQGEKLSSDFFSTSSLKKLLSPAAILSDTEAAVGALEKSAHSVYEIFYKISRVTSDPNATTRFLQYPGIRRITETRAITELLSTPQFSEIISRHNVLAFLLNSKFYRTLQDPEVKKAIKNVDLNRALDDALHENPRVYAFPR